MEPLLRELRQRVSTGDPSLDEGYLAWILVQLDKPDEAITALELYYARPSSAYFSRVWIRYNPIWDSLRGRPRFEALLKLPERKK